MIETAEHEIVLCVDDQEYWLDNERVSIDQPVTTINDEIYIPFELTELFGIPLEIDEEEGIVTINNDVTVIDPLKTFDKGMEAYNNQKYDEAEELFYRFWRQILASLGLWISFSEFIKIKKNTQNQWNTLRNSSAFMKMITLQ